MARHQGSSGGIGKALVTAAVAAGAGVLTVVSARKVRPVERLRSRLARRPLAIDAAPQRPQIGPGVSQGRGDVPDVAPAPEAADAAEPADVPEPADAPEPVVVPVPAPTAARTTPDEPATESPEEAETVANHEPSSTGPTAVDPDSWPAADFPLGAHPSDDGTTFAVHAPDALRVVLEIYAAETGEDATAEFDTARGEDGVWRARLAGAGHGTLYAYRVWGPGFVPDDAWVRGGSAAGFSADVDERGNRFNPNKVLLDPYAREITHNLSSPRIAEAGGSHEDFATGNDQNAAHGRPRREVDTGRIAPKSIVVDDRTSTGDRPYLPPEGTAIYEGHVVSLTAHPSSGRLGDLLAGQRGFSGVRNIDDDARGTYRGVGQLAPYLRGLGVTTLELLPVQATDTTALPGDDGTSNFWGYQTLAFFAPNRDLAADTSPGGPTREFKEMVAALHAAGLELYIDVVFNHSGEGGNWGGDPDTSSFVSLGGFAASEYYVQTDSHGIVDGATGTGNQMNYSSPSAQNLVLDCLTYWIESMGVDGFRFDLAPVLGRAPEAAAREDWEAQKEFHTFHPLLTAIRDLGDAHDVEMIAEAWDLWGYEVGNFPAGWAEWNGRYRDAVRDFLRGRGSTMAFVEQMNGDWPNFHDQGGPSRSINFVTAHDGFTLADVVSYNAKVNDQPVPFGPSDGGSDDNRSWDSDGDHALRRARLRSFLTVLYLSRGVPMIVAGDELGRTQNGNNNPWALNSVGMWTNWEFAASNAPTRLPVDPTGEVEASYHDNFGEADTEEGVSPFLPFAQALAHLRRVDPALRQREWGDIHVDDGDVTYAFDAPDASRGTAEGDRAIRLLIDGSSVGGHDYLVCLNMSAEPVTFTLGGEHDDLTWRRIVDTAPWAEASGNVWPTRAAEVVWGEYAVQPWCVTVLQLA
jgi:glycogen operon protein